MLRVGLTGGIGSGKSTVARMLAEAGAEVVDADALAREVVEPGRPALDEIAATFGDHLVDEDGALDRAALAAVVFSDKERLQELEAITHPRIQDEVRARYEQLADDEQTAGRTSIVVLDHPLLIETGTHRIQDVVLVVVTDRERRVERLVERGLTAEDARARMDNQLPDEERAEVADHVIDNNGDLDDLRRAVTSLWPTLVERASTPA